MRARALLLIVLVAAGALAVGLPAAASPPNGADARRRAESAAAAYRAARYAEAIEGYEALLKEGANDAAIWYNLGNAYFKSGSLGRSILCYERARRVDPSDEDVRVNLAFASARVRGAPEPMPLFFAAAWWNTLKSRLSPGCMIGWSLGLFWTLCAAMFVFFGIHRLLWRRVALAASALVLPLFVASLFLYADAREDAAARRVAVVTSVAAQVRSTPDASGVESFRVHEGLAVEILEARGAWLRVRLADGKDGWLAAADIERI